MHGTGQKGREILDGETGISRPRPVRGNIARNYRISDSRLLHRVISRDGDCHDEIVAFWEIFVFVFRFLQRNIEKLRFRVDIVGEGSKKRISEKGYYNKRRNDQHKEIDIPATCSRQCMHSLNPVFRYIYQDSIFSTNAARLPTTPPDFSNSFFPTSLTILEYPNVRVPQHAQAGREPACESGASLD